MQRSFMIIFIFLMSFATSPSAWAGGAVAATKQRGGGGQQKQMMIQRQQQILIEQQKAEIQQIRQQPVAPEEVKDVVDFSQILESMDQSSKVWPLIIDQEAKEAVIAHYIDSYRQRGINIQKPAAFYVMAIDSLLANNPDAAVNPFEQVLSIVAIMEYDFDNGQNKDNLARKMLGEKGYTENKKRLSGGSM